MRVTGITIALFIVLSACQSHDKRLGTEGGGSPVQGTSLEKSSSRNLEKMIAARAMAASTTAHSEHNGWQVFELGRGYYGIHPEGMSTPMLIGKADMQVNEFLCNDIKFRKGTLELLGDVVMHQAPDQWLEASHVILDDTAE